MIPCWETVAAQFGQHPVMGKCEILMDAVQTEKGGAEAPPFQKSV